jgi:arsenate reductase
VGITEKEFIFHDLKNNPISEEDLAFLYAKTNSYEELFNKRAQKYRALGLKEIIKSDEEYKKYILEEYTFLKRPVTIIDEKIFVGNSPKTTQALKEFLING